MDFLYDWTLLNVYPQFPDTTEEMKVERTRHNKKIR